jgi:RNA polymerase sigma-70 factor (ECF subfamily)
MGANQDAERRRRFENLYRDFYGDIRAYAMRRTSPELVQDVVNESFLVAWRRLDAVPADAKPWLFAVARRVISNQRRSEARARRLRERLALRRVELSFVVDYESASDPEVLRAFQRLSGQDQELLALVAWDDLTPREAAASLAISYGSFRARLHRARGRLQSALTRLDPEGDATASRKVAPSEVR